MPHAMLHTLEIMLLSSYLRALCTDVLVRLLLVSPSPAACESVLGGSQRDAHAEPCSRAWGRRVHDAGGGSARLFGLRGEWRMT